MNNINRRISVCFFIVLILSILGAICTGCSGKNEAYDLLVKAKSYKERWRGHYNELKQMKKRAYFLYKKIYVANKYVMTDIDIMQMFELGKGYEQEKSFLEQIYEEFNKGARSKVEQETVENGVLDVLTEARELYLEIKKKKKIEDELFDQCFYTYKKAYEIDKSVFGKFDLLALGDGYEIIERNAQMKEKLYKEADFKPEDFE